MVIFYGYVKWPKVTLLGSTNYTCLLRKMWGLNKNSSDGNKTNHKWSQLQQHVGLPSVPRRNDPKSPNGRTRIGKSFSNTKTRTRVNMCKPSYGCQYLLKKSHPSYKLVYKPNYSCIRRPTRSHRPSWTCFARLGAAQQSPRWNGPLRRRWPTEPTRPGSLWSCSRNIYRKA